MPYCFEEHNIAGQIRQAALPVIATNSIANIIADNNVYEAAAMRDMTAGKNIAIADSAACKAVAIIWR
ncbi:hypothetical protein [Candidatus Tokpelaia sp.]|uniref:hypothetical protein n=1 Tax=Candidatus Tokpelaia sp. TaxID=2233777 RepID=UPI00123A0184|nr:hypothetical protein [Candidatus Tokpelaia sp.]